MGDEQLWKAKMERDLVSTQCSEEYQACFIIVARYQGEE